MLVDIDGLENKVKPQIKNIRTKLELGKQKIKSISIPSDFSYRTKLRNIPQTISNLNDRIGNIEKWVNGTIDNFTNAENKNRNLMESLVTSIPNSIMDMLDGTNTTTGGKVVSKSNSNSFINEIKESIEGAFDYVFSGEWLTDASDMAKKTASKVEDSVESAFSWALATGAEIKGNVTNFVSTKIEPALEFVGAKISDACDFTYKNIITPTWNFLKATGASVANATIGLVKGLGQLIENLSDTVVMLSIGVGSVFTGISDGATYLIALSKDETDDWTSITSLMWKSVMGYVAEDHVENTFKSFYTNNLIGQWLDENAIELFKSDGIGTNITSGVGYIAGITALTFLTLRNWNRSNWSHTFFYCYIRFDSNCREYW